MAKDFTFKQFHINALKCGMPVSTDAIILGAWANIQNNQSILDIGCGTGLLSLMCAQRNATAEIIGVEIEKNAYQSAMLNFRNSPWNERLKVIHREVGDFTEESIQSKNSFDAIICNPPYFNDGETSHNLQRSMARHTSTLPHRKLLKYCAALLVNRGKANLILPQKEGEIFLNLLHLEENNELQLTRLTEVKTTINKPVSRLLIELSKQDNSATMTREQLIINSLNGYSVEFINLTKDFYLKM